MFRNISLIIVLICTASAQLYGSTLNSLDAVKIAGVTVYSQKHLVDSYLDLLGEPLDAKTITTIQTRLIGIYQRDGWIPPQIISKQNPNWPNLLEVLVIEPKPTQLFIDGIKGEKKALVEALANQHLAFVLTQGDIKRFESLLSERLDQKVMCSLEPVAEGFQIRVRPFWLTYAEAQVSNANSDAFGREVLDVYAGFNTPNTKLDLEISSSFQESVYQYGFVNIEQRLFGEWSVDVSGSYEVAKPLQIVPGVQERYSTKGVSVGSAIGGWYRAQSGYRVRMSLASDQYDIESQGVLVSEERLSQLGLQLNAWQNSPKLSHWLGIGLSNGLDALGAQVEEGRPYSEEFLFVRAQYSNVLRWRSWLLQSDLVGQWADDTLPFSERFSAGGEYYLRAFEDGQLSGDSGLVAQFQLAYQMGLAGHQIQPFLKYGYGKLINENFDDESAASAGFGVFWRFREVSATLEAHEQVSAPDFIEALDGESFRVRARISVSF